jgi:hypothetical protein
MKTIFKLLLTLAIVIIANSFTTAQTVIIGGSGVVIVNGNPNTNADLAEQDLRYEAGVALDTVNNVLYIYRHDGAPNNKWIDYSTIASTDTDTRLADFTYSGGKIRWNLYNVKTASVISADSLDISAVNTDSQNLTFTGASSPFTLDISGGTDVTFAQGTGITLSRSSNQLTITNASPDQTVSLTGAGITAISGSYPSFTITSTEVDGSVTNEGLLGVGAGSATTSVITSNTSGAVGVTLTAGTGLSISESTSSNGGTITLTNSAPDQTVSISGTGITVGGTYPSFTLTAADQSATNEAQTISSSSVSASASTVTLSQVSSVGGGTLAVSGTGGVVLTGGANTLTFGTSAVVAKNFADANTQGVAVGGYFYASQDNTMGMTPGAYVRRMF